MTKETTAVAKKEEETALALAVQQASSSAIEALDAGDLLIPKIYHQQSTSKFASETDARPGDFCDSFTGEILAKKDGKLEVIIFYVQKTMIISHKSLMDKAFKLQSIVPITNDNAIEMAGLPFEEKLDNGDMVKNSLNYNYYCLVPSKIQEFPYVLSLSGTKTKCAKKLNMMLRSLGHKKQFCGSIVFEFRSVPEKNDKGSWFGLDVTQGRPVSAEELKASLKWFGESQVQKFVAAEDAAEGHEVASGEDAPF